ncbi:MAG TPA: PfkB family carbohydrate kinase [Solirubrobacteraceae bacterium]|nr:PfkB family carbohydrate kinase [Solirubrobacteraceae bacterium]
MSLTVVGSIAFDAVQTPHGGRERMLGGAAVHFSLAASFFDEVRVVGPVGDDFGEPEYAVLRGRGVNTDDIEHIAGGKTFFWSGVYRENMNARDTLETDLNVFETFDPKLSPASLDCDVLFLANILPELQLNVRRQCERAKFVALDSMDLWMNIARDALVAAISEVDCVILNDSEVTLFTGEREVVAGARKIMELGPTALVVKLGKYGAALVTADESFWIPAFPVEFVADPTGAGDSFAGGFVGCIAAHGGDATTEVLKLAMAYGTAIASFNVEEFGTERVARLTGPEIVARVKQLQRMTSFAVGAVPLTG